MLEMTKLTHHQQLEKLEALIADFNLGKVRKNMGDQLSGGERRRTEIARCLAIDPKFTAQKLATNGKKMRDDVTVPDILRTVKRFFVPSPLILMTTPR